MAIVQIGDHEYEVLANCEKCKAITPHRVEIFYGLNENDEEVRYEVWKCLNCGHKREYEIKEEDIYDDCEV